jgi:hypothetical protein
LAQELGLSPDADRTAPTIQHDPPGQSFHAGKDLIIQATITDNAAVKEATLFYRPEGNTEYLRVNMNPIGNNIYTAAIPQKDVVEPGIEYYIQSSDKACNIAMRGFAFSPLVIAVAPVLPPSGGEKKEPVVAIPPSTPADELGLKTEEPATPAWYKKWWVWTIVGAVVIVGAVAAGGGGGGGGGGGETSTSSVTISGPTP